MGDTNVAGTFYPSAASGFIPGFLVGVRLAKFIVFSVMGFFCPCSFYLCIVLSPIYGF
jgi:hypothetical protein